MKRLFVSDCEGPIIKNDNAFELAENFIPNGDKLFANISKYDDVLADIIHKPGYSAGSTLKLILPFFKAYGITDSQMEEFSATKHHLNRQQPNHPSACAEDSRRLHRQHQLRTLHQSPLQSNRFPIQKHLLHKSKPRQNPHNTTRERPTKRNSPRNRSNAPNRHPHRRNMHGGFFTLRPNAHSAVG